MAWPHGVSKPKTGGRQKGTPNKRSVFLREHLDQLNLIVPDRLVAILPKLPIVKQADVLLALMPYLYPRARPADPKEIQGDDRKLTFTEFIVMFDEKQKEWEHEQAKKGRTTEADQQIAST